METFLPLLIILFLVILPLFARRKRAAAVRQFLNRKKQNKESNEMKELAKRLIGEIASSTPLPRRAAAYRAC